MPAENVKDIPNIVIPSSNGSALADKGPAKESVFPAQPDRLAEALQRFCEEQRRDQERLNIASNNRSRALAFGIPFVSISLLVIAGLAESIYVLVRLGGHFTFRVEVLLLWLVAASAVIPVYYFMFHKAWVRAQAALDETNESYIALRLSTMDGRKEYFREQLFRLSSKASQVFFGDEQRFDEASDWSAKAGNILDEAESTAALSTVQSYLNSLRELVSREEREQREERLWQYAAIVIMFVYVGGLVFAAKINFADQNPLYLFGIPASVILWGAAGSLAAILYRFYTEQGQIRFATEFRWLIARPIIGIIMGGVVYLALSSGMILLASGSSSPAPAPGAAPAIHMEALWIVAFLAGFSDKFYLGVIDLLVARTVRSEEVNQNTVVMQRERIPESAASHEEHAAAEKKHDQDD